MCKVASLAKKDVDVCYNVYIAIYNIFSMDEYIEIVKCEQVSTVIWKMPHRRRKAAL